MIVRRLTAGLLLMALSACQFSIGNDVSKKLPAEVFKEVHKINKATVAKDWNTIFGDAHESLKSQITEEKLKVIEQFVRGSEIVDGSIISVSRETTTQLGKRQTTYDIVYQLETDAAVYEMTYGLVEERKCCEIYNYNLSLQELKETVPDTEPVEE